MLIIIYFQYLKYSNRFIPNNSYTSLLVLFAQLLGNLYVYSGAPKTMVTVYCLCLFNRASHAWSRVEKAQKSEE